MFFKISSLGVESVQCFGCSVATDQSSVLDVLWRLISPVFWMFCGSVISRYQGERSLKVITHHLTEVLLP